MAVVVCLLVLLSGLEAVAEENRIWSGKKRIWQEDRRTPPRWDDLFEEERRAMSRAGKIPVDLSMFVDDSFSGQGSHYQYAATDLKRMITSSLQYENDFMATAIRMTLRTNDNVLVVGSTSPRREALCIALGANSTLTIDYNRLTFDHPHMKTRRHLDSQDEHRFDLIIADSTLDHDGLGRYGDPISPDADLLAIDKLSLFLKQNTGRLLLTVPIGPDLLAFNLMRVYGPIRLPLLLFNYHLVSSIGYDKNRLYQPVQNFRRTYEPAFILRPASNETKTRPETKIMNIDDNNDNNNNNVHSEL